LSRDLLTALFAALGAVIGLFVGAALGSIVSGLTGVGLDSSIPLLVGGLTCASGCAWLGIRLSERLTRRNIKPS